MLSCIKKIGEEYVFTVNDHIYNEDGSIKEFIPEIVMYFPNCDNVSMVIDRLKKIGWEQYISPAAIDYSGDYQASMVLKG